MKKNYTFRYGDTSLSIPVEEDQVIGVLEGNNTTPIGDIKGSLIDSLDNPIGSESLEALARNEKSIAIIVSDMTRFWMRQDLIVPHLVEYLVTRAGKKYEDIVIVIANGTHIGGSKEDL